MGKRIDREKEDYRQYDQAFISAAARMRATTANITRRLTLTPTSGWISAYLAKRSRPVNSVRYTAISRRSEKR